MSERPTKKSRTLQQKNWLVKVIGKRNFFQIEVETHGLLCGVIINTVKSCIKSIAKFILQSMIAIKKNQEKKLELRKSARNKQTKNILSKATNQKK